MIKCKHEWKNRRGKMKECLLCGQYQKKDSILGETVVDMPNRREKFQSASNRLTFTINGEEVTPLEYYTQNNMAEELKKHGPSSPSDVDNTVFECSVCGDIGHTHISQCAVGYVDGERVEFKYYKTGPWSERDEREED